MNTFHFTSIIIFMSFCLHAQNNVLNFDGNNDFVIVNDDPLLDFGTGDFTVEFRINKLQNSSSFSNTYAVSKWHGGGTTTSEWGLGLTQGGNNDMPRFSISSNSTWHQVDATTSLTINQWYHIAGVREGGEMHIYVNGVLEGSINTLGTSAVNNAGRNLRMGTDDLQLLFYSRIELEEVRIWNVARTETEIQANMDGSVSPASTGLVAYYPMDQGVACGDNTGITMLNDVTGNGLDGSIQNFSLSGGCTSNFSFEDGLLPVELLFFNATIINNITLLEWEIAEVDDNITFMIEHSFNGSDFSEITFIDSKNDSQSYYQYSHNLISKGRHYYRLKQIGHDGSYKFSNIESVFFNVEHSIRMYPNPSHGLIYVNGTSLDNTVIRIFDNQGRLIRTQKVFSERIDISDLPAGLYLLKVRNGVDTHQTKIIMN